MSAHLISQVEVLDPEAWENYRERAAPAIAQYGGRYLVRGARADVVEADWPAQEPQPQTVIVAEFPSAEALRRCHVEPAVITPQRWPSTTIGVPTDERKPASRAVTPTGPEASA